MKLYHMSQEEKEYLKNYDIAAYDRPSIATDMAVFSIIEKRLKILLIKRGSFPYRGYWALPGGFCQSGESVYEAAHRELYEETHVQHAYLNLSGIYGDVGRDPRGWIISHTFLALMDGSRCELRAGSDAWETRWFDIEFTKAEKKKQIKENTAEIENEYCLKLTHSDIRTSNLDEQAEAVALSAKVLQYQTFQDYHESIRYEIAQNDSFAFDHAKIIICALLDLQRKAEEDGKIVFDLMPEMFTLTELQTAFETILGRKLLKANFRRKMSAFVTETEQMVEGVRYRPAKLFRRNIEAFYR